MLFQEAGSGNQHDTHKHSTCVLKHIRKEEKKKGKKKTNAKTTETSCIKLFGTVQLRPKFQANILTDFCCIAECSHTFFLLIYVSKAQIKQS